MGMRTKYQDHSTPGVNLGLIITPMLDMSFQILSFFIMTYHPSALEGHIPGSLAPPSEVATKGKENQVTDILNQSVKDEDLLPELQDAVTVTVKSTLAGQPDKVLVKTKIEPQQQLADSGQVGWDRAKQELGRDLKQRRKDGGDNTNIKIECDGDLHQEFVMEVYDICKQSGFNKIHFVPPPLLRQAKE